MTRRARWLRIWVLVCVAARCAVLDAGVDRAGVETLLSMLPDVESWDVDHDGHLVALAGRLTPAGPGPPARVAATFLQVHRDLFGAARGSGFHVESVEQWEGRSIVTVRQSVDGFAAVGEWVEMALEGSVLVSVRGVVLDDRQVPAVAVEPMSRSAAHDVALSLMGPTMVERSTTARRILFGDSHRRCWRVETVAGSGVGPLLQAVVIDAGTGEVLSHQIWPLSAEEGGEGGGSGEGVPPAPPDGCGPVEPPVGGFSTAEGSRLWSGADAGCGRWEFDEGRLASLFHGDCLEHQCDPYPSTDQCDHGEIRRDGLVLAAGLDRVWMRFLAPDREVFMRLRWGPGENQAVPFLVRPAPLGVVAIQLELSQQETWDSAKIHALTLELVDDHQVWIRSLDLWPGPWLELAAGPDVVTDPPGGELVEGERVTALQDVFNAGCVLESGTHPEMRSLEYVLHRRSGSGGERADVVCEEARIPGRIAAESLVQSLPVCSFRLPAAGAWELEARFTSHPSPSASSQIVIQPAELPDVAFDLTIPIDLYSGSLGGWPCRSDLLDRSRYDDPNPPCSLPWVLAPVVSAEGLEGQVEVRIGAWGRSGPPVADPGGCDPDSAGWQPIALPVTAFLVNGSGVVEVPLDRSLLEAVPVGAQGWSMMDLKLAIEPLGGEIDVVDNRVCLEAWVVLADSGLGHAMGPVWVDDDYFLGPEHWPPDGLVWTGLTVVHEEGGASHDADTALVTVTVESGGNEEPRLVWFEYRPGESVSGALIRYRRGDAGFGGEPFLDAGAAEDDGIPVFDLDQAGHGNRSWLTADSQWRTVVWRREAAAPFGGYPVPNLAVPAASGGVLSLHLAPDSNCLLDEVGCASGLHPPTQIDVVGVWWEQDEPPPTPVYEVAGPRVRDGGQWLPPPDQVPVGLPVEFAVEVRNVGSAPGTAVLAAVLDVVELNEQVPDHRMTGSATVALAPGDAHVLELAPPWVPWSVGSYLVSGPVTESGEWIGSVATTIDVVADPTPCPVPAVNLP